MRPLSAGQTTGLNSCYYVASKLLQYFWDSEFTRLLTGPCHQRLKGWTNELPELLKPGLRLTALKGCFCAGALQAGTG